MPSLSLDRHIAVQQAALTRAKNACEAGYYAESIALCTAQLHTLLRRGLWLQSQLTLAEQPSLAKTMSEKNIHYSMPIGVGDRELFYAAEKFGFLKEKQGQRLAELLEQRTAHLRTLFDAEDDDEYELLSSIANELLSMTKEAIQVLRERTEELEKKQLAHAT